MGRKVWVSILLLVPPAVWAQADGVKPLQPGTMPGGRPFTTADRFHFRILDSLGYRGVLGAALGAGISQLTNTPSEWHQGAEGFGKRVASSYGVSMSRQFFAFTMETALKEDPRYFPSNSRDIKVRVKSIIRQAVTTHKVGGGERLGYSKLASALGAGFIANTWQPESTGAVSDGLIRTVIILGADGGFNAMQEFIPFLRPRHIQNPNLRP